LPKINVTLLNKAGHSSNFPFLSASIFGGLKKGIEGDFSKAVRIYWDVTTFSDILAF